MLLVSEGVMDYKRKQQHYFNHQNDVIGVIVDVDQEAAPEFLHEKGSATASKKPSHVAAKR